MFHVYDTVQNTTGDALFNVAVTVRVANVVPGTGALATIYSDNGVTPTTNPVLTGSDGTYSLYVADGRYDFTFTGANLTTKIVPDLAIGGGSSSSTLAVVSNSSNFTAVVSTFHRVTTSTSVITATLPTPVGISGQSILIKKVDSGSGSVSIAGTIDGVSGYTLVNQNQFVQLTSNNAYFEITDNN